MAIDLVVCSHDDASHVLKTDLGAGIGRSTGSAYVLLCIRHGREDRIRMTDHRAVRDDQAARGDRAQLVERALFSASRGGAMLAAHRARFMQWYGDDEG